MSQGGSTSSTMTKANDPEKGMLIRRRVSFRGIIQGVGFRPAVYRLAVSLNLTGFVQNRRSEVVAEVQGLQRDVNSFYTELEANLPEAARVDGSEVTDAGVMEEAEFRIIPSAGSEYTFPPIPPDLALCRQCRDELLDPGGRRYLYPFINCTQCGPRYSVVEDTPFDRETTSMVDFPMCEECRREYESPDDRRFHAQPTCCSHCGPSLILKDREGRMVAGDPLRNAISALREGKIIALQGIGGFHLAADPRFPSTLMNLRQDKERERKPFALMVRDLDEAARLCRLDESVRGTLRNPQNPIVILPTRDDLRDDLLLVSDVGTLGLMLPYTPLHLLLFFHPDENIPYRHLVMTSGNLKGEPIITKSEEAVEKLSRLADLFLCHNRRILFRTDDSVLRIDEETGPFLLRRSRGYVPELMSVDLESSGAALAVGGDLKNAPAFVRGHDVYLAPYIGDVEDPMTRRDFENQVSRILQLYDIEPETVYHDLHPGYVTRDWALSQKGVRRIGVQHHHAHILSVMAEHGLDEVLGLAFDGTGFGLDGKIWGGEFLLAGRESFKRLASFSEFPLPGGDAAIRNPLRIALAVALKSTDGIVGIEEVLSGGLGPMEMDLLVQMVEKDLNSPKTTSLGRIFDAAAAVLGLVDTVSYEGEGPIKLEGAAWRAFGRSGGSFDGEVVNFEADVSGFLRLPAAPLIRHLAERRERDSVEDLALYFHLALCRSIRQICLKLRQDVGQNKIALSGGVFQNLLLRHLLVPAMRKDGFEIFVNKRLPPGDGGLAVGQVYYQGKNTESSGGAAVYRP